MRFLLTRRWLGGLALAVAFAVVCVGLGLWQWDRRTARHAANVVITTNYDRPAAGTDALPADGDVLPGDQEWRPVALSGRYAPEGTVVLRQRPLDGTNGVHVLVPLVLDAEDGTPGAGRALLVDRGFVPFGDDAARPEVPAPPTGEVRVVAHLRPPEPAYGDAPEGQSRSIDLPTLAGTPTVADALAPTGTALVEGAYGVLAQEEPAVPEAPRLLPAPPVDEGPHLSYAFQWWVFAAGGFVGYGVVARRHAADLRAEADEAAGVAPPPPPRRRRPTAEDEEDALVDAAERHRSS